MIDVKVESLALFMASIFLFNMESLSFEDGEKYLVELAQANVVSSMNLVPPMPFHPSFSQLLSKIVEQDKRLQEFEDALEELAEHSRKIDPKLPLTFGTPKSKRPRLEIPLKRPRQ